MNVFQEEWYELETKKKLKSTVSEKTPDIYIQNELLQEETRRLKEFVEKSKVDVSKSKQVWEKMKKESDYHKMHHSRYCELSFYFGDKINIEEFFFCD